LRRYLSHTLIFVAGAAAGALLFALASSFSDDSDNPRAAANCIFKPFDTAAVTEAPRIIASRGAAALSA